MTTDPPYDASMADAHSPTTDTDPLPCGYKFSTGWPCLAGELHPIHKGAWTNRRGPEDDHDYQPTDRRKGERRLTEADR